MQPLQNLNILLVKDHHDRASIVIEFLESMGASVDYAADDMTAMHVAEQDDFDVIIMDISLPGIDGLTLCKKLREQNHTTTPILMMTAGDVLSDKIEGFDGVADDYVDDYVVKPFGMPDLVARIRALHKRSSRLAARQLLSVDDLSVDFGTRTVLRRGEAIAVTPAGFEILLTLLKNAPNIVRREDLENQLWGDDPPASDTLRSQIYKLRKAVDKPYAEKLLHTITGTGYRIGKDDGGGCAA